MSIVGTPRILISRLSAMGDCILTLPLLCALRDHYPRASLTWVVEQGAAPLLRGHRCLDHLIVLPKGWLKSPTRIVRLRQQLRELQIDVALDPQSLFRSAFVARLSGAPRRIAFAPPAGRELAPWLATETVTSNSSHLVDRQLDLLAPLGIKWPKPRFEVPEDDGAAARIDDFVRQQRLDPFVVINPGATWLSRVWVMERYGAVARHLANRGIGSVVTWAGEQERTWAEEIVAASGGSALLCPKTTLPELASLLRRARLFIGSDTGPMHVAGAVGTRCVVLHGTTHPERSGPYGKQHSPIQEYFQDGTSRERRRASNDAMRAISVEKVCQACDETLGRPLTLLRAA